MVLTFVSQRVSSKIRCFWSHNSACELTLGVLISIAPLSPLKSNLNLLSPKCNYFVEWLFYSDFLCLRLRSTPETFLRQLRKVLWTFAVFTGLQPWLIANQWLRIESGARLNWFRIWLNNFKLASRIKYTSTMCAENSASLKSADFHFVRRLFVVASRGVPSLLWFLGQHLNCSLLIFI